MKKFLRLSLLCVWSAAAAFAQDPTPTASPSASPVANPSPASKGKSPHIAASKGQSFEDRANATNAEAQKRAADIKLVFDGDSITAAWLKDGLPIWNERYAPLGAVDFGIPGDRTQQLLWRLENGQLNNLKPKLVFLMIGTNNSGTPEPEQIAAGIEAIVKQYRERCPDAVIALQAIFPRGATPDDPRRKTNIATNALIAKLADGDKVIYLDFGDKFLNPDGTLSKEVMPDLLHLSPKGYQIWAEAIQPTVDKYFPKK